MKTMKFFATILAVMMALVACEEPFDPNQQKPGGDTPQTEYGKGTEAEPYTVAGVVKAATGDAWVKGYIVGFMQSGDSNYPVFSAETDSMNTNILLADSIGDEENYIAVQLPKGAVRDGLNLVDNKGNLNQEVLLYGTITNYFGATGIKGPTLCDTMNCSTPGLPVHHQLPEFPQIHVHRVSDAIQPSHPLYSDLLISFLESVVKIS